MGDAPVEHQQLVEQGRDVLHQVWVVQSCLWEKIINAGPAMLPHKDCAAQHHNIHIVHWDLSKSNPISEHYAQIGFTRVVWVSAGLPKLKAIWTPHRKME